MSSGITVDAAPVKAMLARFQRTRLGERLRRGTARAGAMMVPPLQSRAPRREGTLRAGFQVWPQPDPLIVKIGSSAPHEHLVVRRHRKVTPGGRFTGETTSGNPFIDAAYQSTRDEAVQAVADIVFGEE